MKATRFVPSLQQSRLFLLPPRTTTPLARVTLPQLQPTQRRSFISNPFDTSNAAPQTLQATRILSYPSTAVYNIIADVSSYSAFLPFCKESNITKWSKEDAEGRKWPEEAQLVIGWNTITETFTSRLYCAPGRFVEAVAGPTKTTLSPELISHHNTTDDPSDNSQALLKHLLTRWTVRPYHYKPPPVSPTGKSKEQPSGVHPEEKTNLPSVEQTEVSLAIEFQFANPMYATMSAAVAPRIADVMIGAFEKRAEALLRGHGNARKKGIDGVLGKTRPS